MANDTKKEKKIEIEEIRELINIPGINDFIFQAVEQAKEKFKAHINQYQNSRKEPQMETPSRQEEFSKDKQYHFKLNRTDTPGTETGYRWELTESKLENRKDIVMILSEFIKKVDGYEILPLKVQYEIIKSFDKKKFFSISFMKTTESRVTGYVKEVGRNEDKERVSSKNERGMIKMRVKSQDLDKKEMYEKIFQLMEENQEAREDIFAYFWMIENWKKRP